MIKRFLKLILVFFYAINFYPVLGQNTDQEHRQTYIFRKEISKTVELNYILYLPSNYQKEQRWPLLIFLHGNGAQDDINLIREYGPPELIEQGRGLPAWGDTTTCKHCDMKLLCRRQAWDD